MFCLYIFICIYVNFPNKDNLSLHQVQTADNFFIGLHYRDAKSTGFVAPPSPDSEDIGTMEVTYYYYYIYTSLRSCVHFSLSPCPACLPPSLPSSHRAVAYTGTILLNPCSIPHSLTISLSFAPNFPSFFRLFRVIPSQPFIFISFSYFHLYFHLGVGLNSPSPVYFFVTCLHLFSTHLQYNFT